MVLEGNFYGVPEGEYYKFVGRVWDRQQRHCNFHNVHEFKDGLEMLGWDETSSSTMPSWRAEG